MPSWHNDTKPSNLLVTEKCTPSWRNQWQIVYVYHSYYGKRVTRPQFRTGQVMRLSKSIKAFSDDIFSAAAQPATLS